MCSFISWGKSHFSSGSGNLVEDDKQEKTGRFIVQADWRSKEFDERIVGEDYQKISDHWADGKADRKVQRSIEIKRSWDVGRMDGWSE